MGGEKYIYIELDGSPKGSPPREQGKGNAVFTFPHWSRITPAWAGKSGSLCFANLLTQDHPRAGGEKVTSTLSRIPK